MQIATELYGLDACRVWDTHLAYQSLKSQGLADTKRTAERRLNSLCMLPTLLLPEDLADSCGAKPTRSVLSWEIEKVRKARKRVLFVQLAKLPGGNACLHVNDARGGRYWMPFNGPSPANGDVFRALESLRVHIGKELALFPHGELIDLFQSMDTLPDGVSTHLLSYPPRPLNFPSQKPGVRTMTPHLRRLESESIHIIREAVAGAERPVMLYSLGKDSCVMLHLARKAFYPSKPPFPLLHVDTRWKFREMYMFREWMAKQSGMQLLLHINPEAIAKNINPFDHGATLHTTITKTEGLKQALDEHRFDIVFGGARRDEEKSRAKERIFSFRTSKHRWDPKNQRPELWNVYNTRKRSGESIRVFPLSNWTELDIWQYIYQQDIPVVPLYFAKPRPVIRRDGLIVVIDDDRMPILPSESIEQMTVRFRSLGCYPLTGAIESEATSVPEIILELLHANQSERQGRAIDSEASASMEIKKQEGYF